MTLPAHVRADLQQHEAANLEDLKQFLRLPTVSADPACMGAMAQGADYVASQLRDIGCEVEVVKTQGHPIVWGRWLRAPGAPTVMVYGHYDVQPPDPLDLWTTPPFEPTERDGALYARGATDDKGQVLTHIKSAQAWVRATGGLPVNIHFVIEGEEEVGSKNLDEFLAQHREQLRCDVAVISDSSQLAPGIPAITVGLRGIIACEFTVTGPKRDLHSGVFGGAVANPVNGLARVIASLHDAEGRVQIPGFYDAVRPLTDTEREQFAALPFEEATMREELGLDALHGEASFTTLERRWARPTCDVNGIFGGYQGSGPKTIIPAQATAKLTCRLVPDQNPDAILAALEQYLQSQLLPGLRLKFTSYHGCQAFLFDAGGAYLDAAREAIAEAFGTPPVLVREGGSIPVVTTFRDLLGVDTLLLGWGQNTDNLHSPDEHFSIADFHRGTVASAALWPRLAAIPAAGSTTRV